LFLAEVLISVNRSILKQDEYNAIRNKAIYTFSCKQNLLTDFGHFTKVGISSRMKEFREII